MVWFKYVCKRTHNVVLFLKFSKWILICLLYISMFLQVHPIHHVTFHTFLCDYSYFLMVWYVKIRVNFFFQFSYTSLPKFPLKFQQSLPYTGRSQVIDIYHVYTSNILHLITQSRPNHPESESHKHHHHNHNIYNIH